MVKSNFNRFCNGLLLHSCSNDCNVDRNFKKEFDEHIKVIEKMQYLVDIDVKVNIDANKPEDIMNSKYSIPMEDVRNAIFYLSAVTKIDPLNSGICDIEHGIFRPESALKEYLDKWKAWYKNNKCIMRQEVADSLYKIFYYKCELTVEKDFLHKNSRKFIENMYE